MAVSAVLPFTATLAVRSFVGRLSEVGWLWRPSIQAFRHLTLLPSGCSPVALADSTGSSSTSSKASRLVFGAVGREVPADRGCAERLLTCCVHPLAISSAARRPNGRGTPSRRNDSNTAETRAVVSLASREYCLRIATEKKHTLTSMVIQFGGGINRRSSQGDSGSQCCCTWSNNLGRSTSDKGVLSCRFWP